MAVGGPERRLLGRRGEGKGADGLGQPLHNPPPAQCRDRTGVGWGVGGGRQGEEGLSHDAPPSARVAFRFSKARQAAKTDHKEQGLAPGTTVKYRPRPEM